ncbi:hypothetical protein D044_4427B, partial [Vibrio parahaemolyticus EKP-026]
TCSWSASPLPTAHTAALKNSSSSLHAPSLGM